MSDAEPLRARAERFGAWVRPDDRTLLAIDRATARRLGIEGGVLWDGAPPVDTRGTPTAPIEVHVAVTARCPASCSGCYLDAQPTGAHVEEAELHRRLEAIAETGAFTVAFGGGEPLTHPALPALAEKARALGLVPVVTTSGIGLTAAKARALRAFAQINVSHDGVGEAYESVRGFDGSDVAERAIQLLVDAEIAVGVNIVLTRESFGDGGEVLSATCARIANLGAVEAQLLRYKPAGRAASLTYLEKRLTRAQVLALPSAISRIVATGALGVRIDCALVPFLSTASLDPAALASLAVMGCEAGSALAAVKVDGRVAPCSFVDAVDLRPGELVDDFAAHAGLAPFRAFASAPPEPCASCPIRHVCRGGCKVVAGHLGATPFAPDPECPRVIAHREVERDRR
jgi:radical SAM protein with 4Fe4S-binding SPASM domain